MQTPFNELLINKLLVEDSINNSVSNLYIKWLLEQLPSFQKEIMSSICLDGKREIDIAREKKLSKQSVSNAKKRSIQKLKKIYEL